MSAVPQTVLVFGGAFDPPHNGHLHILQNAIAAVQPQRVLVMPTGISPHKASSLTPARVRLRMCRCFLAVDKRVRICGHELRQKGKSYTVDTVAWLQRQYPGAQLILAIGSDMLLHFERWRAWQQLLQQVTLCVQCRSTDDAAALQQKAAALCAAGGRILLCPQPALELSSTDVRAAAAAGQDIRPLVPAAVARLIARRRLYQPLPNARDVARTVREALSPARWRHTQAVCRCAVRMARRFGADVSKARLAALLHDFLKEISESQMLQIFADNGIMDLRTPARPVGQPAAAAEAPSAGQPAAAAGAPPAGQPAAAAEAPSAGQPAAAAEAPPAGQAQKAPESPAAPVPSAAETHSAKQAAAAADAQPAGQGPDAFSAFPQPADRQAEAQLCSAPAPAAPDSPCAASDSPSAVPGNPAAARDDPPAAPVFCDTPAPLPGPLAGLIPADITRRPRPIWHGAAAALAVYDRFGIRDREILSAVAGHTCGRAGMGRLDKIIYLADMVGPERHFDGVDTLRRLCRQDLDAAMRWALDHNAAYLLSRGQTVCPESLAARRELECP